ncbi:MAG: SMP-30/gluconolactonase/LRE family protein [Chloroflexi bacterium]|nr:SMP-30/gluconolactonase/LRE family protein [Chloroflexota bacterium]OJV92407.1 MAG: hypothetical protein BGO39_31265 [Chloroflexi bacterium 54-19]
MLTKSKPRQFKPVIVLGFAAVVPLALVILLVNFVNFGPKVDWQFVDARLDFVGKIAVDANGNIYIANQEHIFKYSSNHQLIATWGKQEDKLHYRSGLAIDKQGRVFVTEQRNNKVEIYSPDGQFIKSWGESGGNPGQLTWPEALAIDPAGFVYIANSGINRVEKFDLDGHFITGWGGNGSAPGLFKGPNGIALDSKGNVYVTDAINNRVQKFDADGKFLQQWGQPPNQSSNLLNNQLNITIKNSGPTLPLPARQMAVAGYLAFPNDITIDAQGNVYVVDRGNQRIQMFDSNGKFIRTWNNKKDLFSQLENPGSIALDKAGNIYVYNWGTDQGVIKYTL